MLICVEITKCPQTTFRLHLKLRQWEGLCPYSDKMIFILICVDAAKSLPPLHGVPIQLEKTQSRYALLVMSEKKELKTWQHRNRFRLQHYSIHICVFFCLNSLSQYQMKCGLLHQWLLKRWLVRWCLFHFNLVYSTGAIEWLLPFTLLLYVWLKIRPKRFVCLFWKFVSTCLPEKLKIRRFFQSWQSHYDKLAQSEKTIVEYTFYHPLLPITQCYFLVRLIIQRTHF